MSVIVFKKNGVFMKFRNLLFISILLIISLLYCEPKKDFLSLEWAQYINKNPVNKQEAVNERKIAFSLYKQKNDREAIFHYEKALELDANSDLYYDYANSLSNIKGKLEDSIKAYNIAISLSTDPGMDFYYNLACAESRAGKIFDSFDHLIRARKIGKTIVWMEKDPDLANIRKIKGWQDIVLVNGMENPRENNTDIAGKMFNFATGGGSMSFYYCGNKGDRTGLYRSFTDHLSEGNNEAGYWKKYGSAIVINIVQESGSEGYGPPAAESPRGPIYSKFKKFKRTVNHYAIKDISGMPEEMFKNIEGSCPNINKP